MRRPLAAISGRELRGLFRLALVVAGMAFLLSLPVLTPAVLRGGAMAEEHGEGAAPEAASEPHAAPDAPGHSGPHATPAPAADPHADPHAADPHAADAHAAAEHGGAHGGGHPPELPNIITILYDRYVVQAEAEGRPPAAWAQFLHRWENQAHVLFFILILITVAGVAARRLEQHPGPLQNAVEFIVEKLDDFVQGILGHRGRALVPFLGTLFIFILMMNYAGLVPFLKSPTASLNMTLAMAICVFLYVQWTGIRSLGIGGYLDHLAGSPRDVVGFALLPLMLPLHVVGELVKPMSLSLRLFGNVTGEDVLLAVFVGLGVALLGAVVHGAPFGIPLQAIVYPLLLIFGFIQALVFTLLSTIYFYMMLPHDEHH